MNDEIIKVLREMLLEIKIIEQVEYDKDITTRNYFDGISDAEHPIRQRIKQLT